MVKVKLLDGGLFAQSFQQGGHLVAFLFQGFFHIARNVVLGMVAGHKHEGNQLHLLDFLLRFQSVDGIVEGGIAFYRSDRKIGMAFRLQHVVEHGILGRGGRIGAVPHQDGEGFLPAFRGQAVNHLLVVFRGVQQGHAQTDFLEQGAHQVDVLAERFHLDAVDDVGRLDDDVGVTVRFQLGQGFHRIQFAHAPLGQPAHDDTRGIGFAELQLGKFGLRLLVEGVDGEGTGVVVRGTEMDHQQRDFIAFLKMLHHIFRHEISFFLCMHRHADST